MKQSALVKPIHQFPLESARQQAHQKIDAMTLITPTVPMDDRYREAIHQAVEGLCRQLSATSLPPIDMLARKRQQYENSRALLPTQRAINLKALEMMAEGMNIHEEVLQAYDELKARPQHDQPRLSRF